MPNVLGGKGPLRQPAEAVAADNDFTTTFLEEVLHQRGTRTTVLGAIFLMFAALAALLAAFGASRAVNLSDDANRVREMSMQLMWLATEVTAAETRYVLTKTDNAPTAVAHIEQQTRRVLDEMTPLVMLPAQVERLRDIRTTFETRFSEAHQVLAKARNGTPPALDMDSPNAIHLREVLDDFRQINAQVLQQRRKAYNRASWLQLAVMLAATFGILALSAYHVRTTLQHMREISASRTRLREVNASLEAEVQSRTRELSRINQLFATSLAGSRITAFSQDRDLNYTWIHNPRFGWSPEDVIGKTDFDILPEVGREETINAKLQAMALGRSVAVDVESVDRGKPVWFRLHADPLYENDRIIGVVCAALDITEDRTARERLANLTCELETMVQRFDVALRGADILVFAQDLDRRMTFLSQGILGREVQNVLGKRDEDFAPKDILDETIALKEDVLKGGEPRLGVFRTVLPDGEQRWYKCRVEPLRDHAGQVAGLIGCAVDISMEMLAETRLRSVSNELRTTIQLFETALRGADVIVFTQDNALRYSWVSAPIAGHAPEDTIGRTDEDIAPPDVYARLVDFKQRVLDTGQPEQSEFRFPGFDKTERWYALWAEPQRDSDGEVTGIVGALVDVTERRQRETHIRVLMRELTHRTKNLLAVIQAMARQTLTTSISAKDFENRFSGRLQGLASSLDLLVLEDWEGASIEELVRSQLVHYQDFIGSRIKLSGPVVKLTPEAAQNFGLAFHELSTNSSKYGALSDEDGQVDIHWELGFDDKDVERLRFRWRETGGPTVQPPRRKGFGHAVIERLVPRALNAIVDYDFSPEGVTWSIDAPADIVRAGVPGEPPDIPTKTLKPKEIEAKAGHSTAA